MLRVISALITVDNPGRGGVEESSVMLPLFAWTRFVRCLTP